MPDQPRQIEHTTIVPVSPAGTLEGLVYANHEAFRRGAPPDAAVTPLVGRRPMGDGRPHQLVDELFIVWHTDPEPDPAPSGRGVLLARRLRSGVLAVVRLRRG